MKLLIADASFGGGKPQTLAEENRQLTAQLAAARATIASLQSRVTGFETDQAQRAGDEAEISKRMRLGFTRDQARAILQRQREHDETEKRKAEGVKAETKK
jgi:hypothetical protein